MPLGGLTARVPLGGLTARAPLGQRTAREPVETDSDGPCATRGTVLTARRRAPLGGLMARAPHGGLTARELSAGVTCHGTAGTPSRTAQTAGSHGRRRPTTVGPKLLAGAGLCWYATRIDPSQSGRLGISRIKLKSHRPIKLFGMMPHRNARNFLHPPAPGPGYVPKGPAGPPAAGTGHQRPAPRAPALTHHLVTAPSALD